jgi:stage II sporulation protein AA (anti-sigma F factor antagonist)
MDFRTRKIDDVVVYDLEWEFKIVEEMPIALQDDVKSQLNSGKRRFLFNLEGVKYMDSYGLGEIVASFISISNAGGRLKLTNLLPRIRLMFEVTGLDKVFAIADDERSAIEELS